MRTTSYAATARRALACCGIAALAIAVTWTIVATQRASASARQPVAAAPSAYRMPRSPASILVIGDRIAGYERYSHELPLSVAVLLSHFTPRTRWLYAD